MEKRHEDTIMSRLEDVLLNGCSHITDQELYHWYGVEKKGIMLFRDLEQKWQVISKGAKGPLMKVEGRSGIYLFAKNEIKQLDFSHEKNAKKFDL